MAGSAFLGTLASLLWVLPLLIKSFPILAAAVLVGVVAMAGFFLAGSIEIVRIAVLWVARRQSRAHF